MCSKALWAWGRLRDFERDGILDEELANLLARMALMVLALHKVQSESHPLEVDLHALGSGLSVRVYRNGRGMHEVDVARPDRSGRSR